MKTRHIIAIGLLSALAVAVLGIAIHTSKAKPKTLQTNADNNITTLADTQWQFYETINPPANSDNYWSVNFGSNNEYFKAIGFDNLFFPTRIIYKSTQTNTDIIVYDSNSNGWQNENYKTIYLVNGTDITNTNLIEFVSTYGINKTITNLTGTTWQFYNNVEGIGPWSSTADYWNINFISNEENFVRLAMSNDLSPIGIWYNTTPNDYNNKVYDNGTWSNNNYKTIHITGGEDQRWVNAIEFICLHAIRINTIYDDIYNQGYTNGYDTGYLNGQNIGHAQGYQTGYEEGQSAGYTTGFQTGYTTGETAGYDTGYLEGANASYSNGYTAGQTEGYNTGYEAGLSAGAQEAYQQGYTIGYGIGYNDSDAFNHPIALQPLMLNILTMPFTFISQAFDVTLWPGTAYEFNFANFIKGMLAIASILFIIKLFTSGFSIIGNYTTNIRKEAKMRSDNRKSKQAWKSQKIAQKGAKQANKE